MDQLNGTLSIDHLTKEELDALAPHKSAFDLNEPRKVSRNLSMPKPVLSTIASWLHYEEMENDPVKLTRMDALPDAP